MGFRYNTVMDMYPEPRRKKYCQNRFRINFNYNILTGNNENLVGLGNLSWNACTYYNHYYYYYIIKLFVWKPPHTYIVQFCMRMCFGRSSEPS